MKQCARCGKLDTHDIFFTIRDANNEYVFCPNCAIIAASDGIVLMPNKELHDDVTGKAGAVEFVSKNERYVLAPKRMLRLIEHRLWKKEVLALREKFGEHPYMLHEDFYAEDGSHFNY